ncbi:hypothetical protein V8E36_004176 [Tilletia maclaganii]
MKFSAVISAVIAATLLQGSAAFPAPSSSSEIHFTCDCIRLTPTGYQSCCGAPGPVLIPTKSSSISSSTSTKTTHTKSLTTKTKPTSTKTKTSTTKTKSTTSTKSKTITTKPTPTKSHTKSVSVTFTFPTPRIPIPVVGTHNGTWVLPKPTHSA